MSRGNGWLFRESRLDLFAAISGMMAIIWSDRISETIAPWALPVTVVLGIVYVTARVVVAKRRRRLERRAVDAGEREPRLLPPVPPAWQRPDPVFGRESEVDQALSWVRESGFVVVAGPRDIGTSSVAAAVVQRLVDRYRDGDVRGVHRFDLRSRSTRWPDGTTATAGRIVAAFGIDEPSDDTDLVLARAARRLVVALGGTGVLMLDNVSTPEQVEWLVRAWPPDGGPQLVVAGETGVLKAGGDRALELTELAVEHLREIWDAELHTHEPGVRAWLRDRLGRWRDSAADGVDELLKACLGRPTAVRALAREIRRPGSSVTVAGLLDALHSTRPVDGPLGRVWTALLNNARAGLPDRSWVLLRALAELPVTSLTPGAVKVVLGSEDPEPLEELTSRGLVRKDGDRYRLPQEFRRAIVATGEEDDGAAGRREVALRAVPALVAYFAELVETWVLRLDTNRDGARTWFRESEPSLRPLFDSDYLVDDELLGKVLGHLCGIADALETWYVREQQSRSLLEVNRSLYELVMRVRLVDLAALASIRQATAHRLARRFGPAVAALDLARSHIESVTDERVRAELEVREQVERALLAMTGPEPDSAPDTDAVLAAVAGLERLRATAPEVADQPAVLVNLGALALVLGRFGAALDLLREAEKAAVAAQDDGAQAHSVELRGIALCEQDGRLLDAVRCWQFAHETFTRIGESRGTARCLQHLGSAALTFPEVASHLDSAGKSRLDGRAAARVALRLLEEAKELRDGQPDTEIVEHYLDLARELSRAP